MKKQLFYQLGLDNLSVNQLINIQVYKIKKMNGPSRVRVRNNLDGRQVEFDQRIGEISTLLSFDFESTQEIIEIPSNCQISTCNIEQIKLFGDLHNYNLKKVKTPSINFQKFEQQCTSETKQFISQCLSKKNDEQMRSLLKASNYFKVETLSRIISLYLLDKYKLPLEDQKVKQKLKEHEVQQSSKKAVQRIKQDYFHFFKSYSYNLLTEIDAKKV